MSFKIFFSIFFQTLVFATLATSTFSSLSPNYYDYTCPNALSTIKSVVKAAVQKENRMGASLLRLHFHDCFVNGCDGSVLLDSTPSMDSEKNANPNINSARGFEVIDEIKQAVDQACGKPVVSCADILTIAARDSVVALGGPSWKVKLGRRDSRTASRSDADTDIPGPSFSHAQLLKNFENHGLNEKDLVALSGAHTIGFSRCLLFRDRIYNDNNINSNFAKELQNICPRNGGDSNLAPLDNVTPRKFDVLYFADLIEKKGVLHSDQVLLNGGFSGALVRKYSYDTRAFYKDFAKSMIKMGDIKPLVGNQGEVRYNCRKANSY